MISSTLTFSLLAVLPTIWPQTFSFLQSAKVDVDPENMLSYDEPVRVFHRTMKAELSLHDIIVLGIVNNNHHDGVFNVDSLQKIYALTEYARGLRWESEEHPGRYKGVVEIDIIAPSTVDNVEPGSLGEIKFEWLMPKPPTNEREALAIRRKAARLPFLQGTLLSEDGKAICLYIPITSKDVSYQIAKKLQEKIASFGGDEEYHITGLPVAEDTFGEHMFKQMATSGPLTMLIVFLLMLYFFRNFSLIVPSMVVAIVSVLSSVGLLVITGNTIHLLSSMIPVFVMPIAVLNSIHILSAFYDHYQEFKDRRKAMLAVMETLFTPMLFTSLTTMAGFASLAIAPIPPVKVFGIFVAFGVMMAWGWTITFVPAYVMFIRPESLADFGLKENSEGRPQSFLMNRILASVARVTFHHPKSILALILVFVCVAVYGIMHINVNDNPVRWFDREHPIRIADRELNKHFGGTYMVYLAMQPEEKPRSPTEALQSMKAQIPLIVESLFKEDVSHAESVFSSLEKEAERLSHLASSKNVFLTDLERFASQKADEASEEEYEAWDRATLFVSTERQRDEVFKDPSILNYVADLQAYLKTIKSDDGRSLVGKSNALTDIVKTVYRDLMGGNQKYFVTPTTRNAVAQTILQYESSHRPNDLWHFVVPETKDSAGFRKLSLWIQLKSGDNRDVARVEEAVNEYLISHQAPIELRAEWFGLSYINLVWQKKMVGGMLKAFLGSFFVVFFMMILLFRSGLWGVLCMIPLTISIGLIYGVIGLIGMDYNIPVAVLSSLSLGLAVDYAIHFIARSRVMHEEHGSWEKTIGHVFGEPARALTRNALVVGIAFLSLIPTELISYRTVGAFIAAILVTSWLASILILAALITILEPLLFPVADEKRLLCKRGTCIAASATVVALVGLNIHQFTNVGLTALIWTSAAVMVVLCVVFSAISRREACR